MIYIYMIYIYIICVCEMVQSNRPARPETVDGAVKQIRPAASSFSFLDRASDHYANCTPGDAGQLHSMISS